MSDDLGDLSKWLVRVKRVQVNMMMSSIFDRTTSMSLIGDLSLFVCVCVCYFTMCVTQDHVNEQ